ncbi:hypothetical protein B0J18DRAFT_407090 [Chaetomium sp. MPI-SDFR-AT-0129]|nr:hypothetical protein B0J18DRAFT_407090 [Chaetomium sp. MPI-SDFR-AT-0129]
MGVTRTTRVTGTGPQPVTGQTVTVVCTGWLKDTSKPENKGDEFDSSEFEAEVGAGKHIKGFEEALFEMREGEHATLDITSDYGYGEMYNHHHIPKNGHPGALKS